MAEAVKAQAETYLANFEGLETEFRGEPPWLRDLRRSALSRFSEQGFPTIRDEDWRYTNVAPIARTRFQAPEPIDPRALAEALGRVPSVDLESPKMVFVNGAYSPELSSVQALSPALRVSNLSEVLAESPEEVEPHLARYSAGQDNAFSALNTSFMRDGTFIHVPAGTV
jgi:Fe-S cluster assembly protein SufD